MQSKQLRPSRIGASPGAAVTSDGVVVGAAGDGAGEDGERVVEGHGGGDADADGVAGAAVDAEDDAAHARALALLHVPHVPPREPLHLPLSLSLSLLSARALTGLHNTGTGREKGFSCCPTNCSASVQVQPR